MTFNRPHEAGPKSALPDKLLLRPPRRSGVEWSGARVIPCEANRRDSLARSISEEAIIIIIELAWSTYHTYLLDG